MTLSGKLNAMQAVACSSCFAYPVKEIEHLNQCHVGMDFE